MLKLQLMYVWLPFVHLAADRWARCATLVCLLGGMLALSSCGSSGPGATNSADEASGVIETGAYEKTVNVPGSAAVVALFPDGQAYYSPDGFNLGGGGSTVSAYSGDLQVLDIVGLPSGVETLMSDGSVYLSANGMNLGGGGSTVSAYQGSGSVASLTRVPDGIDAVLVGTSVTYYSPDGLNLGGGARSIEIYQGGIAVAQILAIGPGDAVLTLLANGNVYYSPDNRNIGGGGSTVSATGGSLPAAKLVQVGGGVLTEFSNGTVYLSPDGMNLDGGGRTIRVPSWASYGNATWPARDSAHGAIFLSRLWISGGFDDATDSNSCFDTCSFFDLWSSTDSDGAAWNSSPSFATATAPDPRDASPIVNNGVQDAPLPTDFYDSYSALIVWNGQLTAIGSTVWRSADGVTWLRNNQADGVTAAPGPVAPARATENSRAEILGSTLFFLQMDTGEVYSTTEPNAATWTDLGAIPNFTPRCGAAAFTLQGMMWIVGGGACNYSATYNDVWSSADGVNWTKSATPAQWSGRMWPCAASNGDGVVWLVGGYAPTDWNNTNGQVVRYGANHADLWYTRNGTDWSQLKADLGSGLPDDGQFEPRHAPTCFVVGDSESALTLVIMAGTGGTDPNDAAAQVLNSVRALPLPVATSLP